jgi:hypothetical protein
VSISYYERLEQARGSRPSAQVAALGTALRLTTPEREHLARLAGLAPVGRSVGPAPRPEPHPDAVRDVGAHSDGAPVPADARRLLDRLGSLPAYLVDERQNVVAWNVAAAELIIDFARPVAAGIRSPTGRPHRGSPSAAALAPPPPTRRRRADLDVAGPRAAGGATGRRGSHRVS